MPGDMDGKVKGDHCFIKECLGSKEWTGSSTSSHECHRKQSYKACLYRQWQVTKNERKTFSGLSEMLWLNKSGRHVFTSPTTTREFRSICLGKVKMAFRQCTYAKSNCSSNYTLQRLTFRAHVGKPDVLTCTRAFSYCRCVSGVTVPRIGPTEMVTGCTTLSGYLLWLGMEASWRIMVETIDSIVVALVHGVQVKSHTPASYGLQPGNPSPCRMQVRYDLVRLTRQIGLDTDAPIIGLQWIGKDVWTH
jgi:hypothetical protein